jgi:hypothetical protein
MKTFWRLPVSALFFLASAYSQSVTPFAGRWDFTVTTDRGTYPQWMEVIEKGGSPQIRIQPRGGAVRPAVSAKVEGTHLLIKVSEGAANRSEVNWDLTVNNGKLTGSQKSGRSPSPC